MVGKRFWSGDEQFVRVLAAMLAVHWRLMLEGTVIGSGYGNWEMVRSLEGGYGSPGYGSLVAVHCI